MLCEGSDVVSNSLADDVGWHAGAGIGDSGSPVRNVPEIQAALAKHRCDRPSLKTQKFKTINYYY